MPKEAPKRLVPARPVTDESPGYLPRVPWRAIVFTLLTLTTVVVGYRWKQARKANDLRASIVRVHQEELGEARRAVIGLREKLEELTLGAAKSDAGQVLRDPKLHLPGLRAGQGLYLRLSVDDASDRDRIAKGAKTMEPDHIAKCLGLSPASARGLYDKGEFLMPPWIDEVKKLDDVMTLRVRDEVLTRRIRSDLPSLLGAVRAEWFLLVLQEGMNRRDFPVRVFLWGLRDGRLLLRARVQSIGTLLSARVLSKDAPSSPRLSEDALSRAGASDCSIASQLKTLSEPAEEAPSAETP